MEEDVVKILLNGVPLNQFIAFYIAGGVGAILSFAINVGEAVKKDKATPSKFQLSKLKLKALRILGAVISLAAGIVFWPQISGFLLSSETPIELTLWSAFIVGMGADQLGKKLSSFKK